MKFSKRCEYALRALVVLGQNYGPEVVRIQNISEQQNIPKRFLEQILSDLKSAQIVESKRGVYRMHEACKYIFTVQQDRLEVRIDLRTNSDWDEQLLTNPDDLLMLPESFWEQMEAARTKK